MLLSKENKKITLEFVFPYFKLLALSAKITNEFVIPEFSS